MMFVVMMVRVRTMMIMLMLVMMLPRFLSMFAMCRKARYRLGGRFGGDFVVLRRW
jgi:hypothetical protein